LSPPLPYVAPGDERPPGSFPAVNQQGAPCSGQRQISVTVGMTVEPAEYVRVSCGIAVVHIRTCSSTAIHMRGTCLQRKWHATGGTTDAAVPALGPVDHGTLSNIGCTITCWPGALDCCHPSPILVLTTTLPMVIGGWPLQANSCRS
jgi:hypothetical protein